MSDPYLSLAILACVRVHNRKEDERWAAFQKHRAEVEAAGGPDAYREATGKGVFGAPGPLGPPNEGDIKIVRRALSEIVSEVAALEILLTANDYEERQIIMRGGDDLPTEG